MSEGARRAERRAPSFAAHLTLRPRDGYNIAAGHAAGGLRP